MTAAGADPSIRWVPLTGDFDIRDSSTIMFKGREVHVQPEAPQGGPPTEPEARALIGLLASNRLITDGALRARVSFSAVTPNSVFEFALFRDRDRNHMVLAGLGGGIVAFGIREFAPPSTPTVEQAPKNVWITHRAAGDRSFLVANREYEVEVRLRAGQLTLLVNDVAVATAEVPALRGGPLQAGAFLLNEHPIEARSIEILPQKPKAFVVMQLDGAFDELYQYVIREICDEYEVLALKADEMSGPGVIMEDIVREIETSRLIVADITVPNPNVYFEVGYARALGKPSILLAQKGTKLPFDVAGFRVLFYENSIGGKARLDENLRRHIGEVLR
jgi:hypothetical protein